MSQQQTFNGLTSSRGTARLVSRYPHESGDYTPRYAEGSLITAKLRQLAEDAVKKAQQLGASQAEANISESVGFSVNVRMGKTETVEHNQGRGLNVTVYFGQRTGSATSSDFTQEAIEQALNKACNIAKYTEQDPCLGLADRELMAHELPDLDLYHPWDIDIEGAIKLATACEAHGLVQDERLNNSEGAYLNSYEYYTVYANSHGFVGAYPLTKHSLGCTLLAAENGNMQRDYDYTQARDAKDLWSVTKVGASAAEKTVRRLGARSIKTTKCPVIFAADIAKGLLGCFTAAISGGNLYRRATFLVDSLGKEVFPQHIQFDERPHLAKGFGSCAFDNEGVATVPRQIVKDGVVQNYILSSYTARKLGLKTTGNAGGVHNLFVSCGKDDLNSLIKKMHRGLLVTELMGQGINLITGDYSRGAFGYWVENGAIQYPVYEITIAGNLRGMFKNLVTIASDVDLRGNINTGSILLSEMTIAGRE